MNTFSSYEIFNSIREKQEQKRQIEKRPHEVLYFHKVDDPYSHLTVQYLDKLKDSYDIVLKPILVGEENPETLHEPSLYNKYCLEDVRRIATYYQIEFEADLYPSKNLVDLANSILSNVEKENFNDIARYEGLPTSHKIVVGYNEPKKVFEEDQVTRDAKRALGWK